MAENILSFENIIEAVDITEEAVPVPEWGGSVRVRSLSYRRMGKLKDAVAESQGKKPGEVEDDDVEMEKAILVAGLIDPVIDIDQAELLMDKNAAAVMKVLTAIMGSSKGEKDSLKEEEAKFPEGTE